MAMISVGVGQGARMSELRAIASYPTDRNVLMVDSFDDLVNIRDNARDAICQSKPQSDIPNIIVVSN